MDLPFELDLAACSQPMQVALDAAQQGGAIVKDYFERGVEIRSKAGSESFDLVSDADINSEKRITSIIQATYPDHDILGEEEGTGSTEAEHLWIVDPLDGTNNFAHRIPHFAVSIAYYVAGQAECGVVYNPMRNDWYWAEKGKGSFHNGRRLRVSSANELSQVMVGVGFYYDRGAMMEATLAAVHSFFKEQIHGIRRFGTAALDLCQVADGMFGAFFEYQLSPWDFAAGRLILEEAGGILSNGRGQPLPLAKTSVLASNGHLHPAALKIVDQHHPH